MTKRLFKNSRFNLFLLLGLLMSVSSREIVAISPLVYLLLVFFVGMTVICFFAIFRSEK